MEFRVSSFKFQVLNEAMADESSKEQPRLFVAIPVPEPVRDEIAVAQRELQPLAPHGVVRWTKPEQMHLTLKFLGGVPADRVEELKESVQNICAGNSALRLRAKGIGFFPNARSPRVIWAGVGDEEERLADLQREIEGAVHPFAAEPGAENFVGHLTLGRFKDARRREIEQLVNHAQTMGDRRFDGWTAQEIEIVRSELFPAGASHTLLAAFPLAEKLNRSETS
jgi:2'-5' RNA ligase